MIPRNPRLITVFEESTKTDEQPDELSTALRIKKVNRTRAVQIHGVRDRPAVPDTLHICLGKDGSADPYNCPIQRHCKPRILVQCRIMRKSDECLYEGLRNLMAGHLGDGVYVCFDGLKWGEVSGNTPVKSSVTSEESGFSQRGLPVVRWTHLDQWSLQ